MLKNFPVSLRKSIRLIFFNHSALFIIFAGFFLESKSRNFSSCDLIPCKFSSIFSRDNNFLSSDLPEGSPIIPVPPPIITIGECPYF